jgi:hypothetical protein
MRSGIRGTWRACFTADGDDFPIVTEIDTSDQWASFVELSHHTRTYTAEQQTYRVRLLATPQPYGGVRWWFLCPRLGRRTVKLYLPLGGHRFWSRAAYSLGYGCQREDRAYQAQRQAIKAYSALGGEGNWRSGPPPKPKWMRWRTYDRLADKLDRYSDKFDAVL